MQSSYLSRLIAASSVWSRYRSLLVSSFENIQPIESLQLATRLLSSAGRQNNQLFLFLLHYNSKYSNSVWMLTWGSAASELARVIVLGVTMKELEPVPQTVTQVCKVLASAALWRNKAGIHWLKSLADLATVWLTFPKDIIDYFILVFLMITEHNERH